MTNGHPSLQLIQHSKRQDDLCPLRATIRVVLMLCALSFGATSGECEGTEGPLAMRRTAKQALGCPLGQVSLLDFDE